MESPPVIADQLSLKRDLLVASVQSAVDEIIQTDALTGLRNKRGLDETLEEYLEGEGEFWSAFVEIDKFKAVNTKYGYAAADGYLIEFAKVLEELAGEDFKAFRAHGDEFYLLGRGESYVIEAYLNRVLEKIRELCLPVAGHDEPMQCTVSIGWTIVEADSPDEATSNSVLSKLELAVDTAKRNGRDRLERYTYGMKKEHSVEVRMECTHCETRFTADIQRKVAENSLYCPKCGERNLLSREDAGAVDSLPV